MDAAANTNCPRCGEEMEPIESAFEELRAEQLLLCPRCYLVVWHEGGNLKTTQGIPIGNPHRTVKS